MHLILWTLILLSTIDVASKPLHLCRRSTLWHNFWFASELLYKLIILLNNSHFSVFCAQLICCSIYLRQKLSIMQQFGASMFHMVVYWHKLGEVENECTLHNFVILAIKYQKLLKLVKIWQSYDKNNFDCFFLRHSADRRYTHFIVKRYTHLDAFIGCIWNKDLVLNKLDSCSIFCWVGVKELGLSD